MGISKILMRVLFSKVVLFLFIVFLFVNPQTVSAEAPKNATLESFKQPVLLITLSIDSPSSQVQVVGIKKGSGFVPDYKNPTALDVLEINLESKIGLQHFTVSLPPEEVTEGFSQTSEAQFGSAKKLDKYTYTAIIPFIEHSKVQVHKKFKQQDKIKTSSLHLSVSGIDSPKVPVQSGNQIQEISMGNVSAPADNASVEMVFDGDPTITDPQQTLDIVYIASNFTEPEYDVFRTFTREQTDALVGMSVYPGKAPFSTHKNIIKVRRVVSTGDFTSTYIDTVRNYLVSLGVPFDQFALVYNRDGRGSASLGGGYASLFRTYIGISQSPLYYTHELAHSFAALLDEYVDWYPSSVDLYYHNRNCKEDPSEQWINGLPGGAYLGCYYGANNYRPERDSIMHNIYNNEEFNAPSKYLIEQAFAAYSQHKLAVLVSPDQIKQYKQIGDNLGTLLSEIYLYNIGQDPVSYSSSVSPEASWIIPRILNGNLAPGPYGDRGTISLSFDYNQLIERGEYSTTLKVQLSNGSDSETHVLPLIVYVGDRNESPQLTWISPNDGQIIDMDTSTPVSLSYQVSAPGMKRIEYYFQLPYNVGSQYYDTFFSRTVAPYTAAWDTISTDPNSPPFRPGTYTLWARGFPNIGSLAESNKVNIQVKARPGTLCSNYYNGGFQNICTNTHHSPECFLGAQDCQNQGLSYCCPAKISSPGPSPFDSPSPTSSYTINDLKLLLTNYGLSTNVFNADGKNNSIDAAYIIAWLHLHP